MTVPVKITWQQATDVLAFSLLCAAVIMVDKRVAELQERHAGLQRRLWELEHPVPVPDEAVGLHYEIKEQRLPKRKPARPVNVDALPEEG